MRSLCFGVLSLKILRVLKIFFGREERWRECGRQLLVLLFCKKRSCQLSPLKKLANSFFALSRSNGFSQKLQLYYCQEKAQRRYSRRKKLDVLASRKYIFYTKGEKSDVVINKFLASCEGESHPKTIRRCVRTPNHQHCRVDIHQ